MTGLTIGDFRIGRRVGSGGVGDVYEATDTMLDRPVAIKFLRPGFGAHADLVERFRIEARTLAQLHHPHIATLYALHREGETLAMVMELIDGKTVATLLQEQGRFEVCVAVSLILQALDGIGCAHANGIVHRDLKPSNLMLGRGGVLKVMDFGIARCAGTSRVTRAGNTVGTAQYMSPEQVQGKDTDARSDIYSLCVVLYEMLTHRLPFEGEVEYEIMRAHVEQAPPSPLDFVPQLPPALSDAVLRGLAKDPTDRFASSAELRDALRAAIGPAQELSSDELARVLLNAGAYARRAPTTHESDPSTHSLTELLFSPDTESRESPTAPSSGPRTESEMPDPLAPTRLEVPETRAQMQTSPQTEARGSTLVWELPETPSEPLPEPPSPASAHATASLPPAGPSRTRSSPKRSWKERGRTLLQLTVLVLVAGSLGTPGSSTMQAAGRSLAAAHVGNDASLPEPLASAAWSSAPLTAEDLDLPRMQRLRLPIPYIDAGLLRAAFAPVETHLVVARPDPSAPSTGSTAPAPRPAPTRRASAPAARTQRRASPRRKAHAPRTDESSEPRSFIETRGTDEAPVETKPGEWVLKR